MNVRRFYTLLIILFVVAIATRLIFASGYHVTADDHFYSLAAYEISQGEFNIPVNHWNARIAHTLSVAAAYSLFGVNDYSVIAAAIMYTLLNLIIIVALCKELFSEEDYRKIALIAGFLYALLPISITEGSSATIHQGLTLFMLLALYLMLVAERKGETKYYIFSGLAVGVAYLFHETGAYVFIPMGLYYLYRRRFVWKSGLIFVAFLAVMSAEIGFYYNATGKMFYRQTISLNPLAVKNETRVQQDMSFADKFNSLEPISNPLKGTFIGDSWILEPFRWSLLDPANSILYHIMLVVTVIMLLRGNRKAGLLLVMFAGLYLYFAYGSPNPMSYEPLRRLPRYTLPCAVLASILAGYGLYRVVGKPKMLTLIIAVYLMVSLFSISIKGGEVGQKLYQARHFQQFMTEHPDETYVTGKGTLEALDFLMAYQNDFDIQGLRNKAFQSLLDEPSAEDAGKYLLVNVPEMFAGNMSGLKSKSFRLVKRFPRKKRKICHIGFVADKLSGSLCDLSRGGRVYEIMDTRQSVEPGAT